VCSTPAHGSRSRRIRLNRAEGFDTLPAVKHAILLISLVLSLGAVSCRDLALEYYNQGIDAMEKNDPTAAAESFEKSLSYRRDDPDVHVNLGAAYHALGDYDAALEHFKTALDASPSDPLIHYNMAETYAAMGSQQAATREYQTAIRFKEDFHEALTGYGKLLMEMGNYETSSAR